jgi:hypothetical protein
MRAIARFFLRAKHWQVFLLILVPYAVVFAALVHLQRPIWTWHDFGPWGILMAAVLFFQMSCVFSWFAAVDSLLRSVGNPQLKLGIEFFRFAVVYSVTCSALFPLSFSHVFSRTSSLRHSSWHGWSASCT